MARPFICKKCGNCCRSFFTPGSSQEKVPCFSGDGSGALILARETLQLYDFETGIFPEDAIEPYRAYADLKSRRLIVVSYAVKGQPCPLLAVDNTCTAYAQRPAVCRAFPCPYGSDRDPGLLKGVLCDTSKVCTGELPPRELHIELGMMFEGDRARFNGAVIRKNLFERYGRAMTYRFLLGRTGDVIYTFLKTLESKGEVQLTTEKADLSKLARRLPSFQSVDISILLKEHGSPGMEQFFTEDSLRMLEAQLTR